MKKQKPNTHMCILKKIPCVGYCQSLKEKNRCSILAKDKYYKDIKMNTEINETLNKSIRDTVLAQINPDVIKEVIDEQLKNVIDDIARDIFGGYHSEFRKTLKEVIVEECKVNLKQIKIPDFNRLALDTIQAEFQKYKSINKRR